MPYCSDRFISMHSDLPPSTPKTRLHPAIWTVKIVFLFVGFTTTALLAVPFSCKLLASALLPVLRTYCTRLYLFLAVNLIIVVLFVLKLFEKKLHDQQQYEHPPDHQEPTVEISPPPPKHLHHDSSAKSDGSSAENWTDVACVEKSVVSSSYSASPGRRVRGPAKASIPVAEEDDEMEHESMDATWKAVRSSPALIATSPRQHLKKSSPRVTFKTDSPEPAAVSPSPVRRPAMRKSETFHERRVAPAAAPSRPELRKSETVKETAAMEISRRRVVEGRVIGREVLVTGYAEELNRQFDAFIKRTYDQFRLQRQESIQRFLEMINARKSLD